MHVNRGKIILKEHMAPFKTLLTLINIPVPRLILEVCLVLAQALGFSFKLRQQVCSCWCSLFFTILCCCNLQHIRLTDACSIIQHWSNLRQFKHLLVCDACSCELVVCTSCFVG